MKSGDEVYVVSIKLEGERCAVISEVYEHEAAALAEIKGLAQELMWTNEKTYVEIINSHHFEVKVIANNDLVLASYKVDKTFMA